jgi:hypothetical protein
VDGSSFGKRSLMGLRMANSWTPIDINGDHAITHGSNFVAGDGNVSRERLRAINRYDVYQSLCCVGQILVKSASVGDRPNVCLNLIFEYH